MTTVDIKEYTQRTVYIVAVIGSGYPGWSLRLDQAVIGAQIPTNDITVQRIAGNHEAPNSAMHWGTNPRLLLGVEVNVLHGAVADAAAVMSNVVLHAGSWKGGVLNVALERPLAHLAATSEGGLSSRVDRIETTLRAYFDKIGESHDLDTKLVSAAREALSRLGAPMLFDHRRLLHPLYFENGMAYAWAELRCGTRLELTGPVEVRFCFEWMQKNSYY